MNQCYKCAFKHLAQASKVYSEICQGYAGDVEHIAEIIGDLACAADHLVHKQPELAAEIRKDRVAILDAFAVNPGSVPAAPVNFTAYLMVVFELMIEEEKAKKDKVGS